MPFFFGINNSMTTSGLSRQPTQLDYASPTQFKFNLVKIPKVEYFVTSINIPGVTLGSGLQTTRFKDMQSR